MDPELVQQLADTLLGPVLIGSFFNCAAYAAEIILLGYYCYKFRQDSLWLRCLVGLAFLNDTFATALGCWVAYNYSVRHYGDALALAEFGIPFVLFMVSLCIAAICTQGYLIRRFHLVSKMWYLTALFCIAAGVLAGMTLYVAALTYSVTVETRSQMLLYTDIMFILAAVTDTVIAISLCAVLYFFYRGTEIHNTRSLLRRLMWYSVESGAAPSILAITALSLFHSKPDTNTAVGSAYVIGRVYTCTLILNLLLRQSSAERSTVDAAASAQVASTTFKMTKFNRHNSDGFEIQGSGIHTVHTTEVVLEEDKEYDGSSTKRHFDV